VNNFEIENTRKRENSTQKDNMANMKYAKMGGNMKIREKEKLKKVSSTIYIGLSCDEIISLLKGEMVSDGGRNIAIVNEKEFIKKDWEE